MQTEGCWNRGCSLQHVGSGHGHVNVATQPNHFILRQSEEARFGDINCHFRHLLVDAPLRVRDVRVAVVRRPQLRDHGATVRTCQHELKGLHGHGHEAVEKGADAAVESREVVAHACTPRRAHGRTTIAQQQKTRPRLKTRYEARARGCASKLRSFERTPLETHNVAQEREQNTQRRCGGVRTEALVRRLGSWYDTLSK